jgi:hypothetical protein
MFYNKAFMSKITILVIEDVPLARKGMAAQVTAHTVDFTQDTVTVRKKFDVGKHELCFIDLELGENDDCFGLGLIPIAVSKGVCPVVMSGHV